MAKDSSKRIRWTNKLPKTFLIDACEFHGLSQGSIERYLVDVCSNGVGDRWHCYCCVAKATMRLVMHMD